MTKKIEPHSAWSDDILVPDEIWEEIERVLGKSTPEDWRKRASDIINNYYVGWCFHVCASSPGVTREYMNRIRATATKLNSLLARYDIFSVMEGDACDRLLRQIDDVNEASLTEIIEIEREVDLAVKATVIEGRFDCAEVGAMRALIQAHYMSQNESASSHAYIFSLRGALFVLVDCIDDVAGEIESGPGSPPNILLNTFLNHIFELYRELAGMEERDDNFYEIVRIVAELITAHADAAYGKYKRIPIAKYINIRDPKQASGIKDTIRKKIIT